MGHIGLETQLADPKDARYEIVQVEVRILAAPFESIYGANEGVPDWLLHPSSRYLGLPRTGQYSTLVRIKTANDFVGVGEAFGLPSPEVNATIITRVLRPMILGQDALAVERIWQLLYSAQEGGGHTKGFYLEAMSGIDMALWDLRGNILGQPIHRLLGGPIRDSIPCYASPIPFLPSPQESASWAKDFVVDGYKGVKLKLGRGIGVDIEHARAVRGALGPEIDLLVDLNCAYTVDQAVRLGRLLEDSGVIWLEEPLAPDDLDGLAEVRAKVPMAVVNGETEFTKFGFREALLKRAVDVIMPNLSRAGGITETRRIAALAQAFHVDIAPHGVGSVVNLAAALQVCAATANMRLYEHNRLPNPLRADLASTPIVLEDGALRVPTGPGLGIALNEDVLDDYTVGIL